jgi:hypothetical protein
MGEDESDFVGIVFAQIEQRMCYEYETAWQGECVGGAGVDGIKVEGPDLVGDAWG